MTRLQPPFEAQRIAVIGGGISGLAAARYLSARHRVTLFEAADRLGGHTATVDVSLDGRDYAIDTGFNQCRCCLGCRNITANNLKIRVHLFNEPNSL